MALEIVFFLLSIKYLKILNQNHNIGNPGPNRVPSQICSTRIRFKTATLYWLRRPVLQFLGGGGLINSQRDIVERYGAGLMACRIIPSIIMVRKTLLWNLQYEHPPHRWMLQTWVNRSDHTFCLGWCHDLVNMIKSNKLKSG